ncbi:MAG: glycine--tRNA ligase subunit beta [Burkholderiales bacterium]|nr:MAG: glycine--tRNA ligase subunit beta [Burkholderiales bacterium]
MSQPLLIELLTEELPPRALRALGQAFADGVARGLNSRGLAADDAPVIGFASPRRLAVRVAEVVAQAPQRQVEVKGPSVKVALDADGKPTQALLKWADRQGAPIDALTRASDGKQECFFYRSTVAGERLADAVQPIIEQALEQLPIPKLMQYQLADGATTVSFVRPAHRLVVLHGAQVLPARVLGLDADRLTDGHRFLGERAIELPHAAEYEQLLAERGRVIASFETRRDRIAASLAARAAELGARLTPQPIDAAEALSGELASYVDEVTALVEWPCVYVGEFEREFLSVPQECLILTMRTNQKYFPLFDTQGRLLARFLIVSNIELDDPADIVDGNQRVVRPRLADARFFYEQDRRTPLAARTDRLAAVVYHARLGSQLARVERLRMLAREIAALIGADPELSDRAALLAKADLTTGMVGEFPELQGTMGRYYAMHDGESTEVAVAIEAHYQPRFAGDALPASRTAQAVALADKLETLAGIWGIGQQPSGDKDPFALRRHALGVARILLEDELPVELRAIIELAFSSFSGVEAVRADTDGLHGFFTDRLRGYLRDRGHDPGDVDAVLAVDASRLDRVPARLDAVRRFRALPEAASLAAANKRIGNILKKTEIPERPIDVELLSEHAEKVLYQAMHTVGAAARHELAELRYTEALRALAALRDPVDTFFDHVMVMAEDVRVRTNRLAMLGELHALMNRVADLSKLAA